MAKFYGIIGYLKTEETKPGVWEPVVIEKKYSGEFVRKTTRWQNGTKVNDDIVISSSLSIVADSYALKNKHLMKYAMINDVAWEITSIEPQYPRLILELGGVYNGPVAGE